MKVKKKDVYKLCLKCEAAFPRGEGFFGLIFIGCMFYLSIPTQPQNISFFYSVDDRRN